MMPRFSHAQCKANRERATTDAAAIVHQLLNTAATCKAVAKQYGIGASVLWEIFSRHTTPEQRRAARIRKQQQHMNNPVGKPCWLHARIRKGERRAKRGPTACVPIGTVRVRNDHGQDRKVIKVRDEGPRSRRWALLAHVVWERNFGPMPNQMTIEFIDGNPLNCEPQNLRLMSRGQRLTRLWKTCPDVLARRVERLRAAKRRISPQRKGVAARYRAVRGPLASWWECAGCGGQVGDAGEVPERCPKCQGRRFIKITQRAA